MSPPGLSVKKIVDRNYPRMAGGEDFAFMLEKVPGAYIRIGQGGASAHNPYFDFNDEILPLAASVMAATAEKRLRKLNGGGDGVKLKNERAVLLHY